MSNESNATAITTKLHSTPTHLHLVSVDIKSFAGINSENEDSALVVMFEPDDKNKLMLAEADQGKGKSSLLEAIKFIYTGSEPANAINSIANDKKIRAEFTDDEGNRFILKITKTGFGIEKVVSKAGGATETSVIKSPKNWLRENIGPVGVDPHFLKNMSGVNQIEWYRSLVSFDEIGAAKEQELIKAKKMHKEKRQAVGGEKNAMRKLLVATPYFKFDAAKKTLVETESFIEDKKRYSQDINEKIQQVNQRYNAAEIGFNKCSEALDDIVNAEKTIISIDADIAELERKITELKKQKADYEAEILEKKPLAETLDSKREAFNDVKAEVASLNAYVAEKTGFDNIINNYQTYLTALKAWQKADDDYNAAGIAIKELVSAACPTIEGVEVCISEDLDISEEMQKYKEENPSATKEQIEEYQVKLELRNRNGLYYLGKSVTELCESELWSLCTLIWKFQSIPAIFIENVANLGSDAVNIVDGFLQAGGRVYASLMNREQKNLKISFHSTLTDAVK